MICAEASGGQDRAAWTGARAKKKPRGREDGTAGQGSSGRDDNATGQARVIAPPAICQWPRPPMLWTSLKPYCWSTCVAIDERAPEAQ